MNFISNIDEMIKRTKKRQAEYDEKINEIRKTQSEMIQNLSVREDEMEQLPPYQ